MGKIMRNGVQYGVDTADVLSTVAECDASASGGKGTTQVASAKALSELNSNLKANFQAGVDSVYDAVAAKGSTPASKSLSDVIEGINNIKIKGSYNIIKLLAYPGGGKSNWMTADKDYIAVIFMLTGNTPSNISSWTSRCSCSSGSLVETTYFNHTGTGYGGKDSYLGVRIYTDVPKDSSISNFIGTVYGIYES